MIDAVISTKISTPPARIDFIVREDLIERLDLARTHRLTILSAPAGFGKTMLLSHWAAELADDLIWYSLDSGDKDPQRFLLHLVHALDAIDPNRKLMEKYDALRQGPAASDTLVNLLINELNREAPIFIVLDDYQAIQNSEIDDIVRFMQEHTPTNTHFLIASRTVPSIPIARLRAEGQLLEIGPSELRFRLEDIVRFMRDMMGIDLSNKDCRVLEEKTEGWPAGLLLTALSLEGRESPSQFIASLSGSHRYILDYLAEEVFVNLPEVVQLFLMRISILERFNAGICDRVVDDLFQQDWIHVPMEKVDGGKLSSQELIKFLEDSHLFVFPMDYERSWYRFHPLFSEFLQKRLVDQIPEQVVDLHRRAADWYSKHGYLEEAIQHAISSDDKEMAADLITGIVQVALSRGETSNLIRWIEKIPPEVRQNRPILDIALAWSFLVKDVIHYRQTILELLRRVEDALDLREEEIGDRLKRAKPGSADEEPLRQYALLLAYLNRDRADVDATIRLYKQALAALAGDDHFIAAVALSGLASTYARSGRLDLAERTFADGAERARISGSAYLYIAGKDWQGSMQALQGQLTQAEISYRQAMAYLTDLGLEALPLTAHVFIGMADIAFEKNDIDGALDYVVEGLRRGIAVNDIDALREGYLIEAQIRHVMGDADGEREALEKGLEIARGIPGSGCLNEAQAWEARLAIAGGDLPAGVRWATQRNAGSDEESLDPVERLTYARLLLAQGKYGTAETLVVNLYQSSEAQGAFRRAIECLSLLSLIQDASGKRKTATVTLTKALIMAEPEGYVRTFLEGGARMAALLKQSGTQTAYTKMLLGSFGEEILGSKMIDPLTDRELEILTMMAGGLNNADIAKELVIALSTVKTHINHIYGKLGVTRRTQAIVKARGLDLIS